MKKLSFFLLLLAILCTLVACDEPVEQPKNEHTHAYGDWTVTTEATCAVKGTRVRTCACGNTDSREIPTTDSHTFGDDEKCTVCQTPVVYSEGLLFELNEDESAYVVVGLNDNKLEDLFIPPQYNGKPVTAIGAEAFFGKTALVSVRIPNSITEIGTHAFAGEYTAQMNLTTVQFGASSQLNYIGEGAFEYCKALASISLPAQVANIESNAFSACTALSTVVLPNSMESIGAGAFSGCTALSAITLPQGITAIAENLFYSCTALQTVTLPENVISIGSNAFFSCTALTSITLPATVASIDYSAFENCSALEEIVLPAALTDLSENVFFGCTALVTVTIPEHILTIAAGAFGGCSSLTDVIFEQTEGWSTVDLETESATPVLGTTLADTAKACEYLVETFAHCAWERVTE